MMLGDKQYNKQNERKTVFVLKTDPQILRNFIESAVARYKNEIPSSDLKQFYEGVAWACAAFLEERDEPLPDGTIPLTFTKLVQKTRKKLSFLRECRQCRYRETNKYLVELLKASFNRRYNEENQRQVG